jgi:FAD synthetase
MSIRVMAFGTFDVLHPGHVSYLQQAKELGDELVVVIARDITVEKIKGRKSVFSEEGRKYLVDALSCVDRTVMGHDYIVDKTAIVKEVNPDIIALGYDQRPSEEALQKELSAVGWNGKIIRLQSKNPEQFKTSKLREALEL